MIKFFRLTEMAYTPFADGGEPLAELGRQILLREGIVPTDSPWSCDLLVADRYPLGRRAVLGASKLSALVKPILVWTHEPRYCKVFTETVGNAGLTFTIHVMNVYSGDLLLNNFSFYSWAIQHPKLDMAAIEAGSGLRKHKIVTLMKYINDSPGSATLIRDDENIDLCALRQEIALAGNTRNLVDIYGKGWPGETSKGSSNGSYDWHTAKIEILNGYRFNLCMENTNCDHYCTEKIWDAIHAGCLPIYYGKNNRIYDDFPRDSFLDVAEHADISDLLDHVESMTMAEYRTRLAKCVEVYNRFLESGSFEAEYERAMLSTANRVKTIVSRSSAGPGGPKRRELSTQPASGQTQQGLESQPR
jgi:hypothetical protein